MLANVQIKNVDRDDTQDTPRIHHREDVHSMRTTTYRASSQLDDWHHRGDHPIVRHMSLYTYSMWIYRAEMPSHRAADDKHIYLHAHIH